MNQVVDVAWFEEEARLLVAHQVDKSTSLRAHRRHLHRAIQTVVKQRVD